MDGHDEPELFVADCKSCGFHEEYGIEALASEAARDHRARTRLPTRPAHSVVAMRKSIWERGEGAIQAELMRRQERREIIARGVHTETATTGAYLPFKGFYDGLGFCLTPLHAACEWCVGHPWETSRCEGCRGGKKPLFVDWKRGAPLVEEKNVGIVTGSPSGHLVVLDFDEEPLFDEVLRRKPSEVAQRTIVTRTARGYHVYLRQAGVPNMKLLDGVDVRGEGGLVVAPPSVHASGIRYDFVLGRSLTDRLVAPAGVILTPHLMGLLLRVPSARGNTNTPGGGGGGGEAGLGALAGSPNLAAVQLEAADLGEVQAWLLFSPPALLFHWEVLQGRAPPSPQGKGGRSKSDWVMALCFAEMGLKPGQIAWLLLEQPGSKAHLLFKEQSRERGECYAKLTALKAWEAKRRAKGLPLNEQPDSEGAHG